jgi:hypothetical protein
MYATVCSLLTHATSHSITTALNKHKSSPIYVYGMDTIPLEATPSYFFLILQLETILQMHELARQERH